MNARPDIPPDTHAAQAQAADPRNSVWVSANAGAGKTHVLARRVARLLLDGTEPSKILCLTYTRAAAANMANRVFRTLADWAVADDAALGEKIAELEGARPPGERLGRARRLFARALETPGGLKIQTIHAFCESVLHQFPLEANIAAHFSMLDGAMETALFADARRSLITSALPSSADAPMAEAFGHVMECAGEAGLEALLGEIVRQRDGLQGFTAQVSRHPACAKLYAPFALERHHEPKHLAGALWPDPYFDRKLADAFAAKAREAGKQHAQSFAERLIAACDQPDPEKRLDCLRKAFLTEKGEVRNAKTIAAKGVGEHFAGFAEEFDRIAGAVVRIADRLALLRMLHGTRAALHLAEKLLARYEALKTGRGFLDFNDLITRTARLLARTDAGPWVQYKLDQGIDHILLDEAQDTSPDQWIVVKALAEEFFAGEGAGDNAHRTIFAVGDEKQSIYSFQGAEPQSFADTRDVFTQKAGDAGKRFAAVDLRLSFRSTPDVLAAVDLVFAPDDARRGLTRYPEPVGHKAARSRNAGYVELWPSLGHEEAEEPEDWRQSIDHARAPAVRLAENIAATIQAWIEKEDRIDGRHGLKALRAGDVMVLVRKRDRFVHALSRALKHRRIDVAGADRISLPDHIAVKDLIALGRFLLQPEDDLSLAALLRSPVFGLSEEELFSLAGRRLPGQPLGEALRRAAAKNMRLAAIAAQLAAWSNEAAFKPVFEFFAGVLGRDRVRRKMVGRLGPEAGEILDEFLNFCLAAEKTGQAGLEAFLATLESAAPDIRREMDQNRDEVRIMTVHAAKGLEAPVVFLVDGGGAPFVEGHMPRLLPFEPPTADGAERPWKGKGFLWRYGKEVGNAFTNALGLRIKERADDEYRRLLYVGMTRAEDRLLVCGYHGKRGPHAGGWHTLVARGLGPSPQTQERECSVTQQKLQRFSVSPEAQAASAKADVPGAGASRKPLPAKLFRDLPPPEALPRPLAPSGAAVLVEPAEQVVVAGRSPVLDAGNEPSVAMARGLAFHRLLEMLPDLAEDERRAAGERYLARVGANWPARMRSDVLRSAEGVLAAPRFAPLFARGSRAEVAVTGTILVRGQPRTVSGKIDRLAVTEREVLIVDYKTNRPPPEALAEVPRAYVLQLALYRALLAPLYPQKPVSAAILFTENGRLIALPSDALDAAMGALGETQT